MTKINFRERIMPYDKERIQDLIVKARNAREKSYSPYSKFRVGAVLVTVEEKEYTGCNVENVAYGSTTCAEVVSSTVESV